MTIILLCLLVFIEIIINIVLFLFLVRRLFIDALEYKVEKADVNASLNGRSSDAPVG